MPNYFLGNEDLLTTFDRLVRWDEIVPLTEGKDANVADTVSTWREVLSVAGEYIGSEVAKRARQVDELGVIRDNGKITLDLSREMRGPPAIYQSGPAQRLEVPQAPGLVAVVERNPAMFRYDRYLPAEVGRASVLRLRAAFEYGR